MKNFDDVIINKSDSIRKCVGRVREIFSDVGEDKFREDHFAQDSALLNIQRACEQAVDLANHVVKLRKLGVPNEARDSFEFLFRAKIIDQNLSEKMKKMIGFRNIVVHDYQSINIDIAISVIVKSLDDLLEFCDVILSQHRSLIS